MAQPPPKVFHLKHPVLMTVFKLSLSKFNGKRLLRGVIDFTILGIFVLIFLTKFKPPVVMHDIHIGMSDIGIIALKSKYQCW